MKHKIQLSDHFEYRRLIRFTMPSILMMILPLIWSLDGIWYSIVVAEFMAVVVTLLFLVFKHKKFGYW